MPRSETVISVFVASPGDVREERDILNDVVNELNVAWSKSLNIRFELLRWETSIRPGVGSYAQDVINSQIQDDYDLLIAIFWGRIGTPTPSYASGTVEELYRALEKNKKNNSPEIMVYFKDAPIAPSRIDPDQLSQITSLKEELNKIGCLYFPFDDTSSFESLVRTHLSGVAQKISTSTTESQLSSKEKNSEVGIVKSELENQQLTLSSQNDDIDDIDDYGFFDYIDIYESKISNLNGALNGIAEATILVNEQIIKRTAQLSQLKDEGSFDHKKVRKIVDLSSSDLDQYTFSVTGQLKIMHDSRVAVFDAMSHAISLSLEASSEPAEELSGLGVIVSNMRSSTQQALAGLLGFRSSIAELPRLSVHLNRAKKRAVIAMDKMAEEISGTISDAQNIEIMINKIISKSDD